MSTFTSTRKMTAKEEMIYDMGFKDGEIKAYEEWKTEGIDEIIKTLSKFMVSKDDKDWQGDDAERLAYNTGVQDCINQIGHRIELSGGKFGFSDLEITYLEHMWHAWAREATANKAHKTWIDGVNNLVSKIKSMRNFIENPDQQG